MKTAKDLKAQFRRLEAAGNDDFELILLGGPDAYATHELHQILRQLKVRRIRSGRQQLALFWLAAMIPIFLFQAILFMFIDQPIMVNVCIVIASLIYILFCFKSGTSAKISDAVKGRDLRLGHIIGRELERRREMA